MGSSLSENVYQTRKTARPRKGRAVKIGGSLCPERIAPRLVQGCGVAVRLAPATAQGARRFTAFFRPVGFDFAPVFFLV